MSLLEHIGQLALLMCMTYGGAFVIAALLKLAFDFWCDDEEQAGSP